MDKAIRDKVKARDGKCKKCGSLNNLTIDHIIPISRGGTNEIGNLQTLCSKCNFGKSHFIEWGFWERIKMAWYVDELVIRVKNEAMGAISSNLSTVRSEFQSYFDKGRDGVMKVIDNQQKEIAFLKGRLADLEKHLKIEYVVEVREEVRGYKKVK